jgi:hypothetical protein
VRASAGEYGWCVVAIDQCQHVAAHRAKLIPLRRPPHRDDRVDVTGARRDVDELLLALDGAGVLLGAAGVAAGVATVVAVVLLL